MKFFGYVLVLGLLAIGGYFAYQEYQHETRVTHSIPPPPVIAPPPVIQPPQHETVEVAPPPPPPSTAPTEAPSEPVPAAPAAVALDLPAQLKVAEQKVSAANAAYLRERFAALEALKQTPAYTAASAHVADLDQQIKAAAPTVPPDLMQQWTSAKAAVAALESDAMQKGPVAEATTQLKTSQAVVDDLANQIDQQMDDQLAHAVASGGVSYTYPLESVKYDAKQDTIQIVFSQTVSPGSSPGNLLAETCTREIESVVKSALRNSPIKWETAQFAVFYRDKKDVKRVGMRGTYLRASIDAADFDALDRAAPIWNFYEKPIVRLAKDFHFDPAMVNPPAPRRSKHGVGPETLADHGRYNGAGLWTP